MNKIILRTALITIAALAIAAAAVFSLWLVCSPSTMADSCERTGNYSLAATCAELNFKYTKKMDDLARCVEDSILSGKDKLIVKYGEKMTEDEKLFAKFCEEKDRFISGTDYAQYALGYRIYLCGHLAVSEYRTGNFDKGLAVAKLGGTRSYNKLIIEIITNGTKDEARKVLQAWDDPDEDLAKLLNDFINN